MRGRLFLLGVVVVLTLHLNAGEKRLNNLVSEIATASGNVPEVRFELRRDAWVHLSAKASGEGRIFLSYDNDASAELGLTLSASHRSAERQNYLPAGAHVLKIHRAGKVRLENATLRQVPESAFSKYGATPRLLSGGDHDWEFLARRLLPHLNTIVGQNNNASVRNIRQWQSRGGRWFVEVTRPESPIAALDSFGFKYPFVSGIFVDEFWPHQDNSAWTRDLPELAERAEADDKEIRLYFADDAGHSDEFIASAFKSDIKVVWEKYLGEISPSFDERARLHRDLVDWMEELRRWHPRAIELSSVALGFFAAPPLSLNRSPEIDFKVWMDLQFQTLATAPAFDGLGALMVYGSRYTDEETVRWAGALFRHYCIEGRTNLLSAKHGFGYRLTHLRNGDFREGLSHWKMEGASRASYQRVEKLGLWQGRFPYAFTWDGALAIDGGKLSQPLRDLKRGRYYSAKLVSIREADIREGRSEPARHPVSLRVRGGAALPEKTYREVLTTPAIETEPFMNDAPLWLNYHYVVFIADGPAELEIEIAPNAETHLLNFVEVQPYFAD